MLEVHNLHKRVPGKQVLRDLHLRVNRGQVAVFLGGSGVGKTTLLRVLCGLDTYEVGSCSLDGKPLDAKNHTVGMVFQHFNLFEHLTVEENITIALIKCLGKSRQEAQLVADDLLERYDLKDKAQLNVKLLSGGQKQRVSIARTVAMNPQVICLDEPTSALDPRLTCQIASHIMELASENRVVLVSTHDLGLLEELDAELFFMQEGTIVESGSKRAYKENPSLFPQLYQFLGN